MAHEDLFNIKKYLETLNSKDQISFLLNSSEEPGYEGCSNAQSIYKKMLNRDTYFLDTKKDADRLLNNIKGIFGEELYYRILFVLKFQQKEKADELKKNAPEYLFHASPKKLEGDVEPQKNTDQFSVNRDKKMVFASNSKKKIQLHYFRDAYRSDGHKATSLISEVMDTPFRKRKIALSSHLNPVGYLYKFSSKTFRPVVRLDGFFDNEWVSFKKVRPVKIEEKSIDNIGEKGNFLFFTFPNIKTEENLMNNISTHKENLESRGFSYIEELVKDKKIIPVAPLFLRKYFGSISISPKINVSGGNDGR